MLRAIAGIALSLILVGAVPGGVAPAVGAAPRTEVGLPLANEANPYERPVARMMTLLAGFTHWPDRPESLRLCVVQPADHAGGLTASGFARETGIRTTLVTARTVAEENCQIVYVGRMSIAEQRAITDAFRDRPTLTVAENDPACRSRAMVCLLFGTDSLSFRLNIDAVSRSRVRIDPRVLRMGMGASQ
ncbi:YfiR family protein [Pelagerythrobacter marensis]|uniref:YfiR family protein n=1 Tax=Pelagerythrobacter marensis TaxID=543877 RepID=A0ABZ2D1F0_9SPHN